LGSFWVTVKLSGIDEGWILLRGHLSSAYVLRFCSGSAQVAQDGSGELAETRVRRG
jgi:hypothetical protein